MAPAAALHAWLPYEDRAPVLKAHARDSVKLGGLRTGAAAKGMTRLASGIDNARGWICGESMSAER